MDILVTGGAGFIGGAVVRQLVARGDRIVAIVRDPARATALRDLGVELRTGDLTRTPAIVDAMRGCDAVIHLAGDYRIGIPARERPAMLDANIGSTARMLDAAATSGIARMVYASTVNVFGDTGGRIVDERYRRDLGDGFLSYYDETKFLAQRAVEERVATGLPAVIAIIGTTYGPGDHAALGAELEAIAAYQVGAESGLLQKPVLALAVTFQGHHKEHADLLAKTVAKLGGKPVLAKTKYTFPVETLKNQNDVLRFAATLEKGAVSAYLGAVPVFGNRDLAKAAASILGDEAMHWAILRNALGEVPVPSAFMS